MTGKQLEELPGIGPGRVLDPGLKPTVSSLLSHEACRVQRERESLAA